MAGQPLLAPPFPSPLDWFNTQHPVSLGELRGSVVLLNFATYCSLPCIEILRDLAYLENRYSGSLTIIGVHSPRFPGERTAGHIRMVIARHNITHPIINDTDRRVTGLYGISRQPALVVIDTNGIITGATSGHDKRHKLDRVIGTLLKKTGRSGTAPRRISYRKSGEHTGVLFFPGRIHATHNRLFIADSGHNRILETTVNGQILQQFGDTTPGFRDGGGTAAAFNNPQGMLLADSHLYVADAGNHAIRRIHLKSGETVTVAGTGRAGGPPQDSYFGNPLEVDLNTPCGLAMKGNILYIAMSGTNQIWSLSLVTRTLEVIAGSGRHELTDGAAHLASFAQPSALCVAGNTLYVADAESSAIRAIDLATRHVTTLVGNGLQEYGYHDGRVPEARLQYPLDLNADQHAGSLWIADTYNNKIRKIELSHHLVSSVPVNRPLHQPGGLAFNGNTLYIANTNRHEIVRLDLQNGRSETLDVNDAHQFDLVRP